MADEQSEVRRINWNEVFTVTHVFKSFRMAATHFSKMALALAAVLLIGLWAWLLGAIFGWAGQYVPYGEITAHASMSAPQFEDWQKKIQDSRPGAALGVWIEAGGEKRSLSALLTHLRAQGGAGGHFEDALKELATKAAASDPAAPDAKAMDERANKDWNGALGEPEKLFKGEVERIEGLIANNVGEGTARKLAEDKIARDTTLDSQDKKDKAKDKLKADLKAAQRALAQRQISFHDKVQAIRGKRVSAALLEYEGQCLSSALMAVRRGNLGGGMVAYRAMLSARTTALPSSPPAHGLSKTSPAPADDPPGLLYWTLMGIHGFGWLFCQHWFFAILLLAVALAIWALLGGAMHRMSALHFAREEKISLTQAVKFAADKFLSFYTAPLIPLGLVLGIGVLVMLGGFLLGSWGGGIPAGVLFGLALLGGGLMAFLLIGLLGGCWMMYPTIAVEGSDSLDAISRSYSYVLGRPWRAAFYVLVALAYGTICYLFVRLFVFLVLGSTHFFVGAGVWGGGEAIAPAADRLDLIWPAPTFDDLVAERRWGVMTGPEWCAAGLIWLWVIPVAAVPLAFLLSFFSSASTVIYFLLRRKVDATDLDDVYVEEAEEAPAASPPPATEPAAGEPAAPAAEPAEPAAAPAPEPAVPPEPPAEPQADDSDSGGG